MCQFNLQINQFNLHVNQINPHVNQFNPHINSMYMSIDCLYVNHFNLHVNQSINLHVNQFKLYVNQSYNHPFQHVSRCTPLFRTTPWCHNAWLYWLEHCFAHVGDIICSWPQMWPAPPRTGICSQVAHFDLTSSAQVLLVSQRTDVLLCMQISAHAACTHC